ncbi:MAG: MarR family transcriptional regulator [Myxococcota bacterium]
MPRLDDMRSLERAHAYRLTRVARLLRYNLMSALSHAAEAAGEPALSPEQFFLLFRLKERDGRSHRELADPVLDDRPNITRLVTAMGRQGLVKRQADPEDGRRVRVYLTDKGRALIVGLEPEILRVRQELFGDIPEEEFALLERLLDRLETKLS